MKSTRKISSERTTLEPFDKVTPRSIVVKISYPHHQDGVPPIEAETLRATSGEYGVIRYFYSWFPTDKDGRRIGTGRFTPAVSEKWTPQIGGGKIEPRVMCVTVLGDLGSTLDSIQDVNQLREALADISLGASKFCDACSQ